jgi:hypothetical protein
MRLLAVGGHSRSIGKTALVVDLIRAFPEAHWTAVKITQYGHGVCSINGEHCGCAPHEHAFSLDEERERNNRSDTSRFLVAGAMRSLWLRSKQGQLAEALPALRQELRQAGNVVVESNSILGFLRPQLYLVVLDPRQTDFKETSRQYLDRTDAFVLRNDLKDPAWVGVPLVHLRGKPHFVQTLGEAVPVALVDFVRNRFFVSA